MGALLYETVSGTSRSHGDDQLQIFANVMTKPPLPFRADLRAPPGVEQVIRRCLRRPREERYGSMTELAAALRGAVA